VLCIPCFECVRLKMGKTDKTTIFNKLKSILLVFGTTILYLGPGAFVPMEAVHDFYPILFLVILFIVLYIAIKTGVFAHFKETFRSQNLLWLLGFVIVGYILGNIAHYLYLRFVPALDTIVENEATNNFVDSFLPTWFVYILMVVIAPIYEELMFREYFYRFFSHKWLAYILSILLFTLIHTRLTWSFFEYLPMSVIVTSTFHRYKRVSDSIIVHGGYNLMVLIFHIII